MDLRSNHVANILKSDLSNRTIPILDKKFIELLKEYLESNKNDYPFQDVSSNKTHEYMATLKRKYNIKFNYHMARHYFCSCLFEAGINPKLIQKIMGHHSLGFTMDRYTHLIKDFDKNTFKDVKI